MPKSKQEAVFAGMVPVKDAERSMHCKPRPKDSILRRQ
jgi:hypothetical protein